MSIESVRALLREKAPDVQVIELGRSSSTETLALEWKIKPAQIAKTLTLRVGDRNILVVACGDSRLDNKKVRAALGGKARMVPPEQAAVLTGHPVGGICPFGLASPLPVFCDVRLKDFEEVVPAAGSTHAALRIHPLRLAELVGAEWVDLCEVDSHVGAAST